MTYWSETRQQYAEFTDLEPFDVGFLVGLGTVGLELPSWVPLSAEHKQYLKGLNTGFFVGTVKDIE